MANQLNDAQRKAVMHGEGPLLVLAGPGSGKTFVITRRILYLIEEMQVAPEEILVITFTKEAAMTMQQRFQEQSAHIYPVNFGTFHSIFYHILKQSTGSHQTRPILQQSQKIHLLYPIVTKYSEEVCYDDCREDISLLIAAISIYKNTGSLIKACKTLSPPWNKYLPEIYRDYEGARKRRRLMDFDDMVYECARLLEKDSAVRHYWQNRFRHILMDEFQDINPMQYKVIRLLSREPFNLFAVGDDDQAIYGFRGSEPACLKQFLQDYHASQVLLNINYRSAEDIIKASMMVISENKNRFQKLLKGNGKQAGETAVRICVFADRELQYQYLVNKLLHTADKCSCAVLFRTNSGMHCFAAWLRKAGITFSMQGEKCYRNRKQELGTNLQLMTIHASKGLEFEKVWIPDCNEKVFPHGNMPDKEACEEERRIFYVGMTRAKKSLELLCITGTKERPRLVSRFLNPLWKYYSSSPTTSSNSH